MGGISTVNAFVLGHKEFVTDNKAPGCLDLSEQGKPGQQSLTRATFHLVEGRGSKVESVQNKAL